MDDFLIYPLLNPPEERDVPFEKRDPMVDLDEDKFRKIFRISKDTFLMVVDLLSPLMRPPRRPADLDIPTRILAALRFYAGGAYQNDIGCNKFIGVSQSSISRAIHEVTDAFNHPQIFNRFVHFPANLQEMQRSRQNFFETFQFPGVIGCIDCTHIAIVPPQDDPERPERDYVNRKNFHSINVQLICDSSTKILNVVARFPGRTHDAYIWNQSAVQDVMREVHRAGHSDFFLLGDSGYPLRPWLLTPMEQEPAPNTPEHRYNIAHRSVRSIIERCNGLLKARFRCCLKDRVLHYTPETACKIINACTILHNICIENNLPELEEDMVDIEDWNIENNAHEEQQGARNPDLVAGRAQRNRVIARFRL